MFYAVRLCGNPNHERYMKPIEFITEYLDGNDHDSVPLERGTEEEIEAVLIGHGLYLAGWIKIIEID